MVKQPKIKNLAVKKEKPTNSFLSIQRNQQLDLVPNGAPVGAYFKNYSVIDKDIQTLRYTNDGPEEQRSLQIKEQKY